MGKYQSSNTYSLYPTTEYPAPVIPLDVELLMGICQQQGRTGDELRETIPYLEQLLNTMGVDLKYDSKNNMYITKGVADVYPCMVAHLDTVHDYQQGYGVAVSEDGQVLYAYAEGSTNANLSKLSPPIKQAGVGGDDRVGIAIAIQLLREFPAFKAAFFVEEECGGAKGSGQAYMPFFEDVSLVLQCDRQGASDWVQTAASTKVSADSFIESISSLLSFHGYKPIQSGGFTDVCNLKKRGLGVSAANMSCGYYQPHSSSETIHLPTMQNTLNLCYSIFQLLGGEKQLHTYEPYVYKPSTYSGANRAYTKEVFSPYAKGFSQVKLEEDRGNYQQVIWKWELRDKEGTLLLGPLYYGECEKAYNEYMKKVEAEKAKEEKKQQEELKAVIKQWVEQDGTWSLDRTNGKKGIWVKRLAAADGELLDMTFAAKLLDIPYSEGEFRREFATDLLEGTLTVREVYNLLLEQAEELERLAQQEERDSQRQLQLSLGTGEREDDDHLDKYYLDTDGEWKKTKPSMYTSIETCPHCKSVDERWLGQWSQTPDAFYCIDCGMYSDEEPDVVPHTPKYGGMEVVRD